MRRPRLLGLLLAALAGTVKRGMDAPPEVLDYFRGKELRPGFSWRDVWGEEHARAFTVAGVMEARVLAEFQAGIDKAITEGRGFKAFREEMQGRLTPLGWWGAREVTDPASGRTKSVDFSLPQRLEITFDSNMRAARAAGQWDRAQRTKKALPYILYVRSVAERPRPEHIRWAGIILPVDDPFWRTHWPPNGWRCKCAVRQISGSARERYLEARKGEDGVWYTDEAPPLDLKPWRNKATGEVTMVPAGIDPGWHTNPGIGRTKTLAGQLTDRISAQAPAVQRAMTARFVASPGFESFVARSQARERIWAALPKTEHGLPGAVARVWEQAPVPVAVLPESVALQVGATRAPVTATDWAVAHNASHHLPASQWAQLQQMLDVGDVHRRARDGALLVSAARDADGRRKWLAILHPEPEGGYRVGTLMPARDKYVRSQQEGTDLIQEGSGEIVAEGRP